MKTPISKTALIIAGSLFAISAMPAPAAHMSNNKADLTSDVSPANGKAIVNYVKGTATWNATVSIQDLPEGIYFLVVRANTEAGTGPFQAVCTLETDGKGGASCSVQDFDLGGFHEALVVDLDGNIILSGLFERRGGNRVSNG